MRLLAQDVYLFEGLRGCNTYLLASAAGMTMVDAGMAGDVPRILVQMGEAGFDPSELRSIVITHAHTDHIGGLQELVRRFNVDLIAHRLEAPVLEGTASLPSRSALLKAMAWLDRLSPAKSRGIGIAHQLDDGDRLDVLDGLRVIHAPGHTPGSLCLYQEERGILFCGDLLFNGNPLTGRGGLRYAPRAFSSDPDEIPRSAQKLAQLPIKALCMGHGEPIVDERGVSMSKLLQTILA